MNLSDALDFVTPGPNGCHIWTRGLTGPGYGCLPYQSKSLLAHRVIYELTKGPIPQGMQIDHLCRNRRCVNPDHLEAVSSRENTLRAAPFSVMANKTHCNHGHEFTEANTYYATGANGRIHRQCRTCNRHHAANYRAKTRKAA